MIKFGCDKCWLLEASEAYEAVTDLPIEIYLINEPHFIVSIRACPLCSQRYLQITTEIVDWRDGEDPIYRKIIPINDAELARLTSSSSLDDRIIESVGIGRQSLKYDWPSGSDPIIYWGTGVNIGLHD